MVSCSASCRRLAAAAVGALLVLTGGEGAAACLDQIGELAARHRLDTTPPQASPGGGAVTSRGLAESGGVIKPPPVADRSVVAPPRTSADRMPTLPDVAPGAAPGAGRGGQAPTVRDQAVERTSLQALLIAARAEAERGHEAGCLERLGKARELLERGE